MTPNLLERASGGRVTWVSLLGIVLVPFLIAGGFVWATWNASDRLGEVRAAVVNNDEAVEMDGQLVPLGRQLAAGLVDTDDDNLRWVLSDDEDAREGLQDGTYAAVVTIPEEFSADALSFGEDDPAEARQATIDVRTSEVGPLSDAMIGRTIADVATSTMNRELTGNYLDNIYLGFNDMGDQMRELGDAADELSSGAGQLADGTGEAAQGAGELASGLEELDAAGGELSGGASQLADGAGELSSGLSQLRDGTAELPESTRQLADGAGQLSSGVDEYTRGVDQLVEGLSEAGGEDAAGGLQELEDGAAQVADGAEGLDQGLRQYQAGLRDAAANPPAPTPEEQAELIAELCTPQDTPEMCQARLEGYGAGVSEGLDQAAAGLDQQDPSTGTSLIGGAGQLAEGARELSDGISAGLGELLEQLQQAAEGAGQLSQAGAQLRDGAGQLADGTSQLAEGMPALAEGIGQAADGSGQLASGAGELATGLGEYTAGVGQVADGAGELAGGLSQLDEGAGELADGTDQFASGIASGAEEIPSYTAPDRERLSEVVSQPISQDADDSLFADSSAIALLLSLALWIGGLVTYLILRAVSAGALSSTASSAALAARALLPGVLLASVQAVALVLLAQSVLELGFADLCTLLVFAIVSGAVFAAIHHALVAWFGGAGRFVAVLLAVLGAAAHVLSAVPGFFMAVKPVLPLTPVFNGVASIVAGTPGLGAAYGALFIWFVLAVTAGWLAIARKRTVSRGQLAEALA
ncbi:YhgE/Pip domain-containing protein [Sediminivirga luteola]|uniref:YhgE/Pip domain-containing protein n=1 Tax=Sediminivirga luteola TaxID=1774748 RepID=UPI001F589129|nr:YhgE/Pip domain-containing protein [Sediminivirga luteola]MCI2266104.1 YhgE/Pip domain-containing protein [Sediminivirga luteola]